MDIGTDASPTWGRDRALAAGTIVVYQPKHEKLQRATDAAARPVDIPLSPDEQQAIVSFGERASSLNQERAEELAALLQPLLPDVSATRLREHANHIAGGTAPR